MKAIFVSLFITCVAFMAQTNELVTNTLKVVWSTNVDNAWRELWKADRVLRTNGSPPYSEVTTTVTFNTFLEIQAPVEMDTARAAPRFTTPLVNLIKSGLDSLAATYSVDELRKVYRRLLGLD